MPSSRGTLYERPHVERQGRGAAQSGRPRALLQAKAFNPEKGLSAEAGEEAVLDLGKSRLIRFYGLWDPLI